MIIRYSFVFQVFFVVNSSDFQAVMNSKHIFILSFIVGALSNELPDYLKDKRCSLKKDFKDCFIKNGNLAIPLVVRGDPEYHIPKMNPMEISFIELISTPSLGLNLTNVKLYGLGEVRLEDLKFSWEENWWTLYLKSDNITIEGDYAVDGKVLIMPIKGNGRFNVLLKNGRFSASSNVRIVEMNGEKYFKPLNMSMEYKFDKVEFNFDNLFDGNKELGDQVNRFLNENWSPLLKDFGPGIASTIAAIIKDIFQKFSAKISLKGYFLDYDN
ncbi:hypothetical protein WA026_005436 [Henosepilachna vigintioctopunctata]|uniref:Uncharacterized protein n=1 Tax=Henosepilachna vigintioctopunctata TaxID=420089 RepID=A0AAW1U5G2_9CUCU